MADPLFDAMERAQLSDLLSELGPEAPTLLAPWTTRDLAAHLILRERDYLAGPGLVLPGGWSRLAERRQRALAQRNFIWLIATLRSGPPPGFFRIGWVRRLAKTFRARRGEPTARIAGPPGELLLYLFGRQGAAHVEVSGPAAAVEAVRRAQFGM